MPELLSGQTSELKQLEPSIPIYGENQDQPVFASGYTVSFDQTRNQFKIDLYGVDMDTVIKTVYSGSPEQASVSETLANLRKLAEER